MFYFSSFRLQNNRSWRGPKLASLHLLWIWAPCPCRLLSAFASGRMELGLVSWPPWRRWLHPACCHESDFFHCHHVSFTAAHISHLFTPSHPCACPFMCPAHGWLWSVSPVSTCDLRMSSTETLLSVGSQYLGERSMYNLVQKKHPWRHVVRDNTVDWRIISS